MTKPTTKPLPAPPAPDDDMDDWAREVWGDIFGLGKRTPAGPPDVASAPEKAVLAEVVPALGKAESLLAGKKPSRRGSRKPSRS